MTDADRHDSETDHLSVFEFLRWKLNRLKPKLGLQPNCTVEIPHCDRDVGYRLREHESQEWIYACQYHFEWFYKDYKDRYTVVDLNAE